MPFNWLTNSILLFVVCGISSAYADSVRTRAGTYHDNKGLDRHRVSAEGSTDVEHERVLTGSSYSLNLTHDEFIMDQGKVPEDQRDPNAPKRATADTISLVASQKWTKQTETNINGGYTDGYKTYSRFLGTGVGQWIYHDTIRLSLGVLRSWTKRPYVHQVGADSEIIEPPINQDATSYNAGIRHLATKTTILDYGYMHVVTNDRPASDTYSLGIRQFIVPFDGAVHLTAAHSINMGRITNETTYGQVKAWQAEAAYLQNLWTGARSRVAYRYYKEDETTRDYGSQLVTGTDLYQVGLAQDLATTLPTTVEALASRYLTNLGLSAYSGELGLKVTF